MPTTGNYPIVLAHGIARFDFLVNYFIKNLGLFGLELGTAADGLHYFKGIARHLRNNGFDVYHASVSFAAGVERRAADLKGEVTKVLDLKRAKKVHVIAHSMGGLDARHMIVRHGMADKVVSLTTIGTPHLGTSFADYKLKHEGDEIIRLLDNVLDLKGFSDLTRKACAKFNSESEHAEATNEVIYRTYAGAEDRRLTFTPLQASWKIIDENEGANDGLVSVTSQNWVARLAGDGIVKTIQQHAFPVPVDHLNEVGWWDLSELRKFDWADGGIFKASQKYEAQIRDAYLDMARNLRLV